MAIPLYSGGFHRILGKSEREDCNIQLTGMLYVGLCERAQHASQRVELMVTVPNFERCETRSPSGLAGPNKPEQLI